MLLMVEKDIKRGICEIDVQKIITNTWKIVMKIKNLKQTYIHTYNSLKWSTTHRVLKSHKSKMSIICVIMKTICPPGYHHNGFVA